MIKKVADQYARSLFKSSKKIKLISLFIFIAIITPLIIMGYINYNLSKEHLTTITLSGRKSMAELASTLLQEKFDRIVDLGISFASRSEFQKQIELGNWEEAVKLFDDAPKNFSYIDNVVIFNPEGTIMAITPSIPEVVGINYAYRDYYKGVVKEWKPYVSEVFKRSAEPSYNIISIAIPIKIEHVEKSKQKILGILLFTIRLDSILEWVRDIEPENGGFTYFVDQNGNVAGHPKFSSFKDVVNFSEISTVQKVLNGESGVEILYNQIENEERVSAYEPVRKYGWGAIVQQPTLRAFSFRESSLFNLLITYGIILFFASFLTYLIILFLRILNVYSQRERVFLESAGDGVFAIDRYWNITLWNKAAQELTGFSADEVIGKPFRSIVKFVNEATKKENIVFIEEAMLYGKTKSMENHTVVIRKDGNELPVGDSASPIFDDNGQVSGCIIVFRDVSKEIEVQKVRDDFTFRIVHDLRSPLTVIASILSEKSTAKLFSVDANMEEAFDLINNATKQMLKMVNDLLTTAKSKAIGNSNKKISISDAIKDIMKNLKPLAITKQIIYEYSPELNLPLVTVPNSDHVNEIFSNLFTNAIKYNKEGGSIIVKHEIVNNFLRTDIKDTGIGIAEKDINKIFASYSRVNEKAGIQGTGLGLYIVKNLVVEAGGKIEFISKEGEGTTFSVYLPIE